jgi:hypothetical protein
LLVQKFDRFFLFSLLLDLEPLAILLAHQILGFAEYPANYKKLDKLNQLITALDICLKKYIGAVTCCAAHLVMAYSLISLFPKSRPKFFLFLNVGQVSKFHLRKFKIVAICNKKWKRLEKEDTKSSMPYEN